MERVRLDLSNLLANELVGLAIPKRTGAARAPWLGLVCCGVVSVCLGQAPLNDNFTNAIPLYGNSVTFTGTLTNATYEPGESPVVAGSFFEGGSVWWSWTATNSTQVVISTMPSDPLARFCLFAVHSATNVNDIRDDSQLDWNNFDRGLAIPNHYAAFTATAGRTYYIRALGDPAGSFTLRLRATNSIMILGPPQDQIVPESGSAFFSVFAAGLRPLKYQWRFNGSNLAGQTRPCLRLHDLAPNQAGSYAVAVSNSIGVVTSSVANLTVSPTYPPLVLEALGLAASNRFAFKITGETGRWFRVWASTNLIDWSDEESLLCWNPGYCPLGYYALVQNTNATSVYSIPMDNPREFLHVSRHMHREICVAHLREIEFAIKLWAAEWRREANATVTESDIEPYLRGGYSGFGLACPSGGTTFTDSYGVFEVGVLPVCQRIPSHVLP